jgi:hypothetical protein
MALTFFTGSKEFGFMKRLGVYSLIILSGCLATLLSTSPASAQQGQPKIQKQALEHSTWNTSPREFQIIDDRPIIKDFREAPRVGGTIDLPPPPQGFAGGGNGGGPGALQGGGPGGSLPGGGVGIPGNGPAYRGDLPGGLNGLPKSGFGRDSNIPGRGVGPGHLLPGVTTGVVGKMMSQQQPKAVAAGPPKGMSPTPAKTNGNSNVPVASYSGGYGNGNGSAYGGSSSKTQTAVRGYLLRK